MKDLHDLDDKVIKRFKFSWSALKEWQKFAVGVIVGMAIMGVLVSM